MLKSFKTRKVEENITVGECLAEKRKEFGISLRELSDKLKIKLEYLDSLEKNDYKNLPPDVYVKGFIKGYAELVGFNPEKMVDLFRREISLKNKIEKISKNNNSDRKFSSPNYPLITPNLITIFISVLALFLVGYYLWHQVSSFNSVPYLFVSSPASDTISDNSEITIEGEAEKESILKINGEDIFVDSSGKFQEIIILQPGRNHIIIEAKNRFNKTAKKEINILYEKKLEPVPSDYINSDIDKNSVEDIIGEEDKNTDINISEPKTEDNKIIPEEIEVIGP